MYSAFALYLGDQCSGTPYSVNFIQTDDCSNVTCSSRSNTSTVDMTTVDCTTDYLQVMRDKFGSSPYIIELVYLDDKCTDLLTGFGYPASGACVGGYSEVGSYYTIASLHENGSATLQYFPDRSCLSEKLATTESADKETLTSHKCDVNGDTGFKWYSSDDLVSLSGSNSTSLDEEAGSELSSVDILGITLGVSAFVMLFLVVIFMRGRRSPKQLRTDSEFKRTASLDAALRGQIGLWTGDIITAKRIPRDKVLTEKLVGRGTFGEVYVGVYNGQKVVVKMLVQANRDNIQHVSEFLAEAKTMATMDHPHIVSFVGVAWDSLSDACVVLEFMEGGELRELLNKYQREEHPVGFNKQKTTIALQICHALTYLHSLMPPLIHRDLKSRNILLNSDMEAKLSDFDISRERLDRTMTSCVGSPLWMAPEVMLGERYDVKANMFSFGVVLSELDVHTLPYARFREENLDSNGHEMTDSILLQKVALGTVQAEFSTANSQSIVEIGRSCMAIDPNERPTAAEALYRLQMVLSGER